MSGPTWKEHFNQPISGYDPVEAQGLSELGYALLRAQIDEQEYLTWARAHFELCSVDVNFFQKNPPPVSLLRRLKEIYPWSPEVMPVAEWDGHLIVFAIERPQIPIPPELKPILLLAPVTSLNPYWEMCLQSIEQNPEANLNAESSLESEVLEGLSLDPPTAVTSLDFSNLRNVHISQATKRKQPSTNPLAVEMNTAVTSLTALAKNPGQKPDNNRLKAEGQTVAKLAATNSTVVAHPQDQEPTMTKAEPASIMDVNSESLPSEDKILHSLSQFDKIYENRCYLEFNAPKKSVKVSLWPVESTKITVIPTEVSFEKDNFLKIVANTQKSYHGHVIKSPEIEKLFKEINGALWPENVTLVPVVRSGEIIGGIMGWGEKSTYNMSTLREMEKVASELSVNLGFKSRDAA